MCKAACLREGAFGEQNPRPSCCQNHQRQNGDRAPSLSLGRFRENVPRTCSTFRKLVPEEYWIYVVERARDLGHQRVSAIANPFQKVEEYWFDDAWRALADEGAGALELNVKAGAKLSTSFGELGRSWRSRRAGLGSESKWISDSRV